MTTYRAHCDAILAADKWTTDRQVAADIGCAMGKKWICGTSGISSVCQCMVIVTWKANLEV